MGRYGAVTPTRLSIMHSRKPLLKRNISEPKEKKAKKIKKNKKIINKDRKENKQRKKEAIFDCLAPNKPHHFTPCSLFLHKARKNTSANSKLLAGITH